MKLKNKMKLDDLYFGVKLYPMSYSSEKEVTDLKTYNLFGFGGVKYSVAVWVVMSEEERKERVRDPLLWCFGDVWSRSEYEFMVCPWGGLGENDKVSDVGIKMDTYEMYVKSNAELLMDMVDRVSVSSARKYLAEERKRFKSCR